MPKKKDNPFAELARKAHEYLKGKVSTATIPGSIGKGLMKTIRHIQKTKTVKTKTKDTTRTKAITTQLRKSLTEKEIAKLRGKQ